MAVVGVQQAIWDRSRPSGQPAEDVMVNVTHHAISGDGWTDSEMDDAQTSFLAFWTALRPFMGDEIGWRELRFYHFDPLNVPPRPFILDGTRAGSLIGTGSSAHLMAPQVALTVTWRTSIRRSWGRIYLGGFAGEQSAFGRAVETMCSDIADASVALVDAHATAGTDMVVWSEGNGGLPIETVEVDDVFDVIRRRRYEQSLFRNLRTPA